MATPNKATVNATTTADKAAIVAAANDQFIADADLAIASAAELGKFKVSLIPSVNVDIATIVEYYTNLGYAVGSPTYPPYQPAQLFGYFWVNYWNGVRNYFSSKNTRIIISWN